MTLNRIPANYRMYRLLLVSMRLALPGVWGRQHPMLNKTLCVARVRARGDAARTGKPIPAPLPNQNGRYVALSLVGGSRSGFCLSTDSEIFLDFSTASAGF